MGGVLVTFIGVAGVAMAALLATGLFRLGSVAATNSRLQARADDRFRGRMMSLFLVGFGGTFPLGALAWSAAASRWGVEPVTLAMAGCTLAAGTLVWRKLSAHTAGEVGATQPAHLPAAGG
jgi:hypothetical protein